MFDRNTRVVPLAEPDGPRPPYDRPPPRTKRARSPTSPHGRMVADARVPLPHRPIALTDPAGGETNLAGAGYAQRLVTTRLLDRSHDPAGRLSRLQRVHPRAPSNCNPPAGVPPISRGAPSPARCGSRPGPIRIRLRRAGRGRPLPARILT